MEEEFYKEVTNGYKLLTKCDIIHCNRDDSVWLINRDTLDPIFELPKEEAKRFIKRMSAKRKTKELGPAKRLKSEE